PTVAAGLNAAFASSSLSLFATVENGALTVRSSAYGSAANFEIRTSSTAAGQTGVAGAAGVWESHAGVDVAGTINGVAAKGSGQILAAPASDATLAGLALEV